MTNDWELQLPTGELVDIVEHYGQNLPIKCDFSECAYKTGSINAFFRHVLVNHFGIGPAKAGSYWNARLCATPSPVTVWEVHQGQASSPAIPSHPAQVHSLGQTEKAETQLSAQTLNILPQNGVQWQGPQMIVQEQQEVYNQTHLQHYDGLPTDNIIADINGSLQKLPAAGQGLMAAPQFFPYPMVVQQVWQPDGQCIYQLMPMVQLLALPQAVPQAVPQEQNIMTTTPAGARSLCQRAAEEATANENLAKPPNSAESQMEEEKPVSIPLPVQPLSKTPLAREMHSSGSPYVAENDPKDSIPVGSRRDIILKNPELLGQSQARIKGVVRCGQLCGFERPSFWEMAQHLDEEHPQHYRPWRCSFGNCIWSLIGFHRSSMLARHRMTAHSGQHSDCRICGRSFQRKDGLLRHMRKRHPCGIP